jgi:excisionase family DNA binding protein
MRDNQEFLEENLSRKIKRPHRLIRLGVGALEFLARMDPIPTAAHSETLNPAASVSGGPEGRNPKPADQPFSKYRLAPDKAFAIRTTPPAVMTLMEGAAYLACSPRTLRDLVADRRVRSARVGAKIVIRREWLDAYLEA